jgi:intermembrane space import and assembly protein 40
VAEEREQEAAAQKALAQEELGEGEGEGEEEGMGDLEEEASQQGAFNEETGEINWACPCLGGMADGPCGEEFRAAFSCFVYSKEEPKGVECIEKFK